MKRLAIPVLVVVLVVALLVLAAWPVLADPLGNPACGSDPDIAICLGVFRLLPDNEDHNVPLLPVVVYSQSIVIPPA